MLGFHVLDLQDDATSLQILPALEVDGEPAYELLASWSLASGHHLTFHTFHTFLLHQNHGRIEVRHVFRMAPVGFYFGFDCFLLSSNLSKACPGYLWLAALLLGLLSKDSPADGPTLAYWRGRCAFVWQLRLGTASAGDLLNREFKVFPSISCIFLAKTPTLGLTLHVAHTREAKTI